jgi:putative transposase
MARLPRYFAKNVPQHIILRGNNREPIFANDEDCQFLREVLIDASQRYRLHVHAYVLMSNHLHLLATPASAESLPKTMQSLGRRYVQYFNYRYQRTGTLWEGRYRATVVDVESYLFECMRYIELNPVRAGMVSHPAEHVWSSYRANGEGQPDALVTPHRLYRGLGTVDAGRQEAYRELVKAPMSAERLADVRTCTHKGWALGGDRFKQKIERLSQRRTSPLPKGRPKAEGVNRI